MKTRLHDAASPLVLVVILAFTLSACGPSYTRSVMLDDSKLDPARDGIEVGTIELVAPATQLDQNNNSNRNGVTLQELQDHYTTYLQQGLQDRGIAHASGKSKYILDVRILGYKEGNAFVRWLSPAGGESRIVVEATLERGGEIVGGVESQQTIVWGGPFSIGGWQQVISMSATEVVTKICQGIYAQKRGLYCN